MIMAAYLLGFVLYFSLLASLLVLPSPTLAANMIKKLMRLLFSTGFSSNDTPNDEDFFNEPSTLRPQLTAAAAKEGAAEDLASHPTSSTYQVVARGLPGAKIHYAAPSA